MSRVRIRSGIYIILIFAETFQQQIYISVSMGITGNSWRRRFHNFVSSDFDANFWINGGFFIFRSEIFDYLHDGEELVEEPFRRLMKDDQLLAFKHEGFWRPMDTLKDKEVLEDLVEQGRMPWRINGAAATVKTAVDRKAG